MKKVYLAALLSLSLMTANAQEPNIPMFGAQHNHNVKFDEYKEAPQGFEQGYLTVQWSSLSTSQSQ